MDRLAVAALVLAGILLGAALVRAWRGRQQSPAGDPALPSELRGAGERTWVVFTTPMCATCDPVLGRIRATEPSATVHRIDATSRPDLAERYGVRSAPTVLRAGPDGRIDLRLTGPAAATAHFGLLTDL